jgi:hypothetical protein
MNSDFKKQADEILKIAEEYGIEQSFLFSTTFDKYVTQLGILERLKSELPDDDDKCAKAKAYNNTADSSNKRLGSLIRLITTMRDEKQKKVKDPLLEILSRNRK